MPVSNDRLFAVKSGLMSLRQAMRNPEQRQALVTRSDRGTRTIAASEMPEEWYPTRDIYLKERVETATPFSPERLLQLSRAQGRELRAIELHQVGQSRTETSLRQVSDVLREYQELEDVLAPPTMDPFGHMVSNEQAFAGLMAASVVFLVAPLQGQTLFSNTFGTGRLIHDVLDSAAADGDDAFVSYIQPLTKRIVAHVRDFLTVLEDGQTGVSLFSAQPTGEIVSSTLHLPRVSSGLRVIRRESGLPPRDFELTGYLTAIDHNKVTFGVEGLKLSKKKPPRYNGKVDIHLHASRKLEGIKTGRLNTYRFMLREEVTTHEYSPDTGERRKYRLLDLEPRD